MESKWKEILSDYTDDKGVTHIDAYTSPDENENGNVIALVVLGDVYYKDFDAMTDPYAQEVIKEAQEAQNKNKQEAVDAVIKQVIADAADGDTTVIDELLMRFCPLEAVIGSLPEEEGNKLR